MNVTPPYLATITADTPIVLGDRDPLYPVSIAFDLHAAIPRSHLWAASAYLRFQIRAEVDAEPNTCVIRRSS